MRCGLDKKCAELGDSLSRESVIRAKLQEPLPRLFKHKLWPHELKSIKNNFLLIVKERGPARNGERERVCLYIYFFTNTIVHYFQKIYYVITLN